MSIIINKKDIILKPSLLTIGEGLHTSKWIKSNGEKETKILWLKGKIENFTSLNPLQ